MSGSPDIFETNSDAIARGLAESVGEFICLATAHGEPVYVNPAGRKLIGMDQEKAASAVPLRDFYDEESWTQLRDVAVPAVNKAGEWQGHSKLRNAKSGELIDVETKMFRIRAADAGKSVCLAIVHRETNERARILAALAESQARKRAILESSLDPIITINHEGVITEFNRAAEQTFGHAREKIIGTKPSEVLFPPSMSAGEQDRIDRYLDVGEGSLLGRRIEVTAVRANGESFPAEMAMTISREEGEIVLTFFVRDISRRKKAEEEQQRYAADLKRSNDELEQFAYVASHDLQEPLRKIRTFGDRLQLLCGDKLEQEAGHCVERMQSAAVRMQFLIDGLLSLSRVTTQGQTFVPVDLGQVAREVVSDLEVQIGKVGGRVEVGKMPTIQADPLQMRQLLQNLIANGLKFRRVEEPPLVKIEARLTPGRRERRSTQSPECRIVVEDNGIGFDDRHAELIFGLFQRLHPRDVFEGTGMGLALCKKIVERHGGKISAKGTPGKGSTFEVVLPALNRPPEA